MGRPCHVAVLLTCGLVAGCAVDAVDGFVFPPRDGLCVDLDGVPCGSAPSEAERTVVLPETMSDTTYVYVIRRLSIPQASDPDGPGGPERPRAVGFDLDGLDSGDGSAATGAPCGHAARDFVSVTDPAHRGVDNAFQGLVPTIEGLLDPADCPEMRAVGCLDAALEREIGEGHLLVLLEVGGVNDFTYDSHVTLRVHVGVLPEGRAPTIGADGMLAPGQAFLSDMAFPAVDGDIFEGRLAARGATVAFATHIGDFNLSPVVTEAQLRFDITAEGLTRGAIGGAVVVEPPLVIDAPPGEPPDDLYVIAESLADVRPGRDPARCEALSIGLWLEATAATLR